MLPSNLHTALRTQPSPAERLTTTDQNEIQIPVVANRKKYLFFKRGFDITFSAVIIITILSWLLPVVALLIKINSKGPVLFIQKRIGRNGKLFSCIKFRTMIQNEEADERPACKNDERITGIGKFLRRTNLDELPQFFNVLKGDMSIVGPRPHMIADCIRFSFIIPSYANRNIVRPGITGWAQVKGYHGPTNDYESIVNRFNADKTYIEKISALFDTKIILKTIGKGFYNIIDSF